MRHSRTNTSRSPDKCGVQISKNSCAGRSAADLLGNTKISYTSSAADVHSSACAFASSIHAERRRTRSSRRCAQCFGCGPTNLPRESTSGDYRKPCASQTLGNKDPVNCDRALLDRFCPCSSRSHLYPRLTLLPGGVWVASHFLCCTPFSRRHTAPPTSDTPIATAVWTLLMRPPVQVKVRLANRFRVGTPGCGGALS